jgi:RNA polymerase subunit RPABC4/transcription elongation factor Spt4
VEQKNKIMLCEKCDTQLKEEAKFCTNCGYRINSNNGTKTVTQRDVKNKEVVKNADKELPEMIDPFTESIIWLITKIKILFPKYYGELMTIIGTGIFSYNIFNFFYMIELGRQEMGWFLYAQRTSGTLFLISIGAMLAISGILIIKNKSK